ncbi:MAG: hypothetical protein JW891_16760 [Candidatus Lokiarchaeota archaeon]|nr:hypothetical protein [Candidatus Lokiarchaeota archaeon]
MSSSAISVSSSPSSIVELVDSVVKDQVDDCVDSPSSLTITYQEYVVSSVSPDQGTEAVVPFATPVNNSL